MIAKRALSSVLLATIAFAAGAAWAQTKQTPLTSIIDEQLAAIKAQDPARYASTYAENAVVLAAGHPMVKGRSAIQKQAATEMNDTATGSTALVVFDSAVSGDLGYAAYTGSSADKAGKKDTWHGVTVFRRVSGEWKAIVDAYSSDQPTATKQ